MSVINVLDEATINQIAAGEVIERPSAVVKELVENALDAGANAITVEIKEGGLSFIRITDNGEGFFKEDIPLAFVRHATSKIKLATDLLTISSLGFRGEALSSVAAVAQVELITKRGNSIMGSRYVIEGGVEKSNEDIGCPNGTTIIIRNLFYNTPARRNFLKSATTEGSLISELMEKLIVSHPDVSFKFIQNNKVTLQSSGNNNAKDILYNIYGREIAKELIQIDTENEYFKVTGFIGKPSITRGNRNYENYFINNRYIKSPIISKAIEEAYKSYMMQRKFPFTSLYFEINPELIDVNVHPQKLEVRLRNSEEIYLEIINIIRNALSKKEMIPSVKLVEEKQDNKINKRDYLPEPFEKARKENFIREVNVLETKSLDTNATKIDITKTDTEENKIESQPIDSKDNANINPIQNNIDKNGEQITLFEESEEREFISVEAFHGHRIIGQVFATYWLIEYNDKLFMIDQHAAHEKVLYEKILEAAKNKMSMSQMLIPPMIISLSLKEEEIMNQYKDFLKDLGYEIEAFGGREYSVRAVPADLYGLSEKDLLIEFIDDLTEEIPSGKPELILEKIASMSCKAAVKANHILSQNEAEELIKKLLTLDNPYHCPHGRPIIVAMTKYEIEKMFKRIV